MVYLAWANIFILSTLIRIKICVVCLRRYYYYYYYYY